MRVIVRPDIFLALAAETAPPPRAPVGPLRRRPPGGWREASLTSWFLLSGWLDSRSLQFLSVNLIGKIGSYEENRCCYPSGRPSSQVVPSTMADELLGVPPVQPVNQKS